MAGCTRYPRKLVGDWRSEPHGQQEARYHLVLHRDGSANYDVHPSVRSERSGLAGKWEYRAGEIVYYGGGESVRYRVVHAADDELVLRDHAAMEIRLHRH